VGDDEYVVLCILYLDYRFCLALRRNRHSRVFRAVIVIDLTLEQMYNNYTTAGETQDEWHSAPSAARTRIFGR